MSLRITQGLGSVQLERRTDYPGTTRPPHYEYWNLDPEEAYTIQRHFTETKEVMAERRSGFLVGIVVGIFLTMMAFALAGGLD